MLGAMDTIWPVCQAVAASSVDGRWPERVVRATECRDAIPLTVPRSVPVPVRVCVRSHGIDLILVPCLPRPLAGRRIYTIRGSNGVASAVYAGGSRRPPRRNKVAVDPQGTR